MILISILIFAGLAYFFAVFLQNKKVGYSLSFTFIALFLIALVMLISNEYSHFGMEKVTSEKTYQIQSAQKGTNLLLEKKLGSNGKENVYVYRTPETAKAMTQNPAMTTAQQKQVTKQAQQAFQAQAQAKLIQEIKNK